MFGSEGEYRSWIEPAQSETDDEIDGECVADENNIAPRCTLNANYIRAGTERVVNVVRADHPWFFVIEKMGGLYDGFFLTSVFLSTIVIGVYKWIQKGNAADGFAAARHVVAGTAHQSELSTISFGDMSTRRARIDRRYSNVTRLLDLPNGELSQSM